VNVALPGIAGSPEPGAFLSRVAGVWEGATSIEARWFLNEVSVSLGDGLTVDPAWSGQLRLRERARSADGTVADALSAPVSLKLRVEGGHADDGDSVHGGGLAKDGPQTVAGGHADDGDTVHGGAIGLADPLPDTPELGGPYIVDPGESFTIAQTVSGVSAGVSVPASLVGGSMTVLDDQGQEVANGVTTAAVMEGYDLIIMPDVPGGYGVASTVTLYYGDPQDGASTEDTASITTRRLSVISSGGFTTLDGQGGSIQVDIDSDEVADASVDAAIRALLPTGPAFLMQPSVVSSAGVLTIFPGLLAFKGTGFRYVLEVRSGATVLRSWDSDMGEIDPAESLVYDTAGQVGVLTIQGSATDSNGTRASSPSTYDTGVTGVPTAADGSMDVAVIPGGASSPPTATNNAIDVPVLPGGGAPAAASNSMDVSVLPGAA
jgi:hypothetical protein